MSVAAYPALAAASYCGDANNASAVWGYRCTNPASPDTSRSTGGDYIVLADARGEFARGWDDGRGVDTGRTLWAWQADDIRAHTHTIPGSTWDISSGTSAMSNSGTSGYVTNRLTASTGGAETRGRNLAYLPVIKY